MKFSLNGDLDAQQTTSILQEGPRCIHENIAVDTFTIAEYDAVDPPAGLLDAYHLSRFQLDSRGACALQQVHAELLGAQPARASHVQDCNGLIGQATEVFSDEAGIEQEISTGRALCGRRRVVCLRPGVRAQLAGSKVGDARGAFRKALDAGAIPGHVEVAAAIHAEPIAAVL